MQSRLKTMKSFHKELSRQIITQNQLYTKGQVSRKTKSVQEIIETLNIYLRSAIDLKNNLSISKNQKEQVFRSDYSYSIKQTRKLNFNEELSLVATKIQFFIKSCQNELKKITKILQFSQSQLQVQSQINYQKVLLFIKDKYAQLLKQSYRTLNMQSLDFQNLLSEEDKQIVRQNRKRKLKQISDLETQMELLWGGAGLQDLSSISCNPNQNRKNQEKNTRNQPQESKNESKSFIVTLQEGKSSKGRNLQVLGLNMDEVNLRQLAREQLEKQFLAIRIQAYTMYENYISHTHTEFNETVRFLKEEQQILESQMEEESAVSKEFRQQIERLYRQVSQVKTINQLIKKRYVVRESIRMDSQEGIY